MHLTNLLAWFKNRYAKARQWLATHAPAIPKAPKEVVIAVGTCAGNFRAEKVGTRDNRLVPLSMYWSRDGDWTQDRYEAQLWRSPEQVLNHFKANYAVLGVLHYFVTWYPSWQLLQDVVFPIEDRAA